MRLGRLRLGRREPWPFLTLEIVAASGSTVYGDDFYACNETYAQYVVSDQLDQLGNVLRGMAHSP